MFIQRKAIRASEDPEVQVESAATDLLFEAEDVAQLLAEATGEPVEVTVNEDETVFSVGEEDFTVTPEGNEEILECVKTPAKSPVTAATKRGTKPVAPVQASAKVIRKVPQTKK